MPFFYDAAENEITMPVGDTAEIYISIDWHKLAPGDVVIFGLSSKKSGEDIFRKAAEIVEGKAVIRLCNADTRDLPPGKYLWQLRIVTNPARDEEGNVIADDCGDDVISVFDEASIFKLIKDVPRV